MNKFAAFVLASFFIFVQTLIASEAMLVRYPHYHGGRITFTYLGDIWTASESGQNIQRLTVNRARDAYPRFSPDGKSIAFSSDRNGNLDVYIIPSDGGTVKQLTSHSAEDIVLGWKPDGSGVLFRSNRGEDFTPQLYLVGTSGGMPVKVGTDMGMEAAFSPDGRQVAYNPKGQVYWRKNYRGSNQTDVVIMDIAAKSFKQVTEFNGMDSWPMWGNDGDIYFVSDRDGGGLTNIWSTPVDGGKAARVTSFKTGDVRWPSMSSDGKTIIFEHNFGIWKLDVASKKVASIPLNIAAETGENSNEIRTFSSQADEFYLAPSGTKIAFSIYGEIFTAPVEEGDLRQITNGPARDRSVMYSPDGKWLSFVSDRSGREEIYVVNSDGTGEAMQITNIDALKFAMSWSPDSKEIAFTTSSGTLNKVEVTTKAVSQLDTSQFSGFTIPQWSPDGKWLTYSKNDISRTSDVYLLASSGAEKAPHRVTFESGEDYAPRFSADGKKIYFQRELPSGSTAISQLYSVVLERQERDPDDPEMKADAERPTGEQADPDAAPKRAAQSRTPEPLKVDWAGLKRRTRQITRMPFDVNGFMPSTDNKTVIFTTSEPAGLQNVPVVYSIQDDGKKLTRIISGQGAGEEGGGGAGGGGGISNLRVARDGKTLFFRERDGVYSVPIPSPSASGPGRGDGARKRVSFTVRVSIDRPAEWAEMFDDAWRTMKYRFYDPKMHGLDWDSMRAKYRPLVNHVGDRQELLNIINEMIGELNASHTGAAPPPGGGQGGVSTGHLGLGMIAEPGAARYRVTHVYENGPADKDWVKVKVGDYLVAINGVQVKASDDYWQLLNNRLNRKAEVSFSSAPNGEGSWITRIETVNQGAYSQLRYEQWVKDRRKQVDELSGGRIGYLHIQAMNQPSLRKFEKEIQEYKNKEALVIDQRWNGGGNIEQQLLALLVQRQYQVWQPRGTEATTRPFNGFFGPKVVLQNWRSASNAEMFPAGFRALGLGKVIGTPTMGAVIGTGSYSLIDGSTVRTPGVGVFLADAKRTNMENFGVQPDILVDNSPSDTLAGRDRQLERAVTELMSELKRDVAKKE